MRRRRGAEPQQLLVDPISCEAVGLCAHTVPELITLDRWGYPIVSGESLGAGQIRAAKRAVRGCPRRALGLARVDDGSG